MPEPGAGEVLIRVARLRRLPHRPARARRRGPRAPSDRPRPPDRRRRSRATGERVGVPWLGLDVRRRAATAASGRENLCDRARFTGCDRDGGYAEYAVADERFCFPIPDGYPDLQAAPLLCAGLIGHRALRMAGDAERLGLYGFGAAAHIVAQVALHAGPARVRVHARGRRPAARPSRASSAPSGPGTSGEPPPEELDAAIIFAPAGALVPARAARARQGRHGGLRGDPHERHPVVPVRAAVGRARGPLGRQPHAPRRRGVPRARAAGAGPHDGHRVPARARRTRRSRTSARGASTAPPWSCRDRDAAAAPAAVRRRPTCPPSPPTAADPDVARHQSLGRRLHARRRRARSWRSRRARARHAGRVGAARDRRPRGRCAARRLRRSRARPAAGDRRDRGDPRAREPGPRDRGRGAARADREAVRGVTGCTA